MQSQGAEKPRTTEEKIKKLLHDIGITISAFAWFFTAIELCLGSTVPRDEITWAVAALLLGNLLLFTSEHYGESYSNRSDF